MENYRFVMFSEKQAFEILSPRLSLIVPTYNEAENIQEFIRRVETALGGIPFEIIIVDDNSPDGTAKLAKELNREYGNIRVLQRRGKLGLGSAVFDGFKMAKSDVLAVLDADLQHPPELLLKMYAKILQGYSLAIASRYVDGGGVKGWSSMRKIVSLGATKLAHLLIPKTRIVKDPMSGFFIVRKECIRDFKPSSNGFKILLEILVKGKFSSIAEIPYIFQPRLNGKSKLSIEENLRYLLLLAKTRLKLLK
ncbi:MAG: polyprenol monophosphomannose synthase [Candidatus Bathyarchaeia archaeon]